MSQGCSRIGVKVMSSFIGLRKSRKPSSGSWYDYDDTFYVGDFIVEHKRGTAVATLLIVLFGVFGFSPLVHALSKPSATICVVSHTLTTMVPITVGATTSFISSTSTVCDKVALNPHYAGDLAKWEGKGSK